MNEKFKKQFPTRKEIEIVSSTRIWKQKDKSARLIQKTFRNYLKRKEDQERADLEEKQTTSSSGGWQSKITSFLNVRRISRSQSRKSSRASDAGSENSDVASIWMNLPLLMMGNDTELGSKSNITVNDKSIPKISPTPTVVSSKSVSSSSRRKSIYNLFLKHQDAVERFDDDTLTSRLSACTPLLRRQSSSPVVSETFPALNSLKRECSLRYGSPVHVTADNRPVPDISICITKSPSDNKGNFAKFPFFKIKKKGNEQRWS